MEGGRLFESIGPAKLKQNGKIRPVFFLKIYSVYMHGK